MRRKKNEKPPADEKRPPRILVPDLAAHRGTAEEITLGKEERTHVRSRRLRDGDEVIALDGKGDRARACLTRRGTAVVLLAFEEDRGLLSPSSPAFFSSLPGEPPLRVTVLLACAEPARVEWAVEKGTECGAAAFLLLACERSQLSHVAALRGRLPRLARIATEAAKQCDRTIVPGIEWTTTLGEFLRKEETRGRLLVADPAGRALGDASVPGAGRCTVAVGPEGGFTPAEISRFGESGAVLFSLGPRVLRLETAVVVALAHLVGGR
jgi:16S rRNA (uracil1498-N3)-methyltransferase